MRNHRLLWLLAGALIVTGCDRGSMDPGGTPGIVHVDGAPLADIQVTVHQLAEGAFREVAVGISDHSGRFELRGRDPVEAVWLEPGDYRVTIESIGEVYRQWPPDFHDPDKTPLHQSWSADDVELNLNVPEPRIAN